MERGFSPPYCVFEIDQSFQKFAGSFRERERERKRERERERKRERDRERDK